MILTWENIKLFEIPVDPDSISISTIRLEGEFVKFRIYWNHQDVAWHLDVIGSNSSFVYNGLKLVCNVDVFEPHGILELGQLWVVDTMDVEGAEDPTRYSLGTRHRLVYATV